MCNTNDSHTLNDWLAIHHTTGLGVKTFNKLLQNFDNSPDKILSATDKQLKESGVRSQPLSILRNHINKKDNTIARLNQQAFNWLNQSDQHHIITLDSGYYPPLLKLINDRPPLLYVKGNLSVLNTHQLAIVGSRRPTISGFKHAKIFANHIASHNVTITSGLATGIDSASHQGAILANKPTIAVIGTGIDIVYPSSANKLASDIIKDGAIISEFPLNTRPIAANFPRRNRIISGMSLGTLVVEAALKSGSLITANLALDYNREVFAIPGSIDSPVSKGCNTLIKNGAKLVETTSDILSELNMLAVEHDSLLALQQPEKDKNLTPETQKLLSAIGHSPVSADNIIEFTALPVSVVQELLIELELSGHICNSSRGYMRVPNFI